MASLRPLTVPPADLLRPLSQRRYPFRPAPAEQVGARRARQEAAEAREAADAALRGVDDMLYALAEQRVDGCREDVEDVVQQVRQSLWLHSLPRFDARRGAKVSTFLHRCARWAIHGVTRPKVGQPRVTSFADLSETQAEMVQRAQAAPAAERAVSSAMMQRIRRQARTVGLAEALPLLMAGLSPEWVDDALGWPHCRCRRRLRELRAALEVPTPRESRVQQVSLDGELLATHRSASAAAEATGISVACISFCTTGVTRTAGGFRWVRVPVTD